MKPTKKQLKAIIKVVEENLRAKDFGTHKMGLTGMELKNYIRYRTNGKKVGKVYRKMMQWFIGQTGSIDTKTGEFLYYYHDCDRGLDKFLLGKETYFD